MCWEWASLTASEHWWHFGLLSILAVNLEDDALFGAVLLLSAAVSTITENESLLHGILLITLPCRTWLAVQHRFASVVEVLLVVWNADTAALVVGRLYQQAMEAHRLPRWLWYNEPVWLQRVSPAKSMIGLVGGLMGGTLTFVGMPWVWSVLEHQGLVPDVDLLTMLDPDQHATHHSLWIGASLASAAIMGDLWESALKRRYAVKDTSRLLPGHGGVLDRFDSSLVAVVVYHYYERQGWV